MSSTTSVATIQSLRNMFAHFGLPKAGRHRQWT